MVRKDPTSDMTSPKNGTDRAIIREDTTRADLSIIMFGYVCLFGGSSSSKLRARGVMVSAYLVIGFVTVVQTAILEATRFGGKFSVNWDSVDSPNIMYPMIAAAANRTVDRAIQVKRTAGNWLLFFREE